MNDFESTTSMAIGMNEWFAPQISEHWPKNTPGRLAVNPSWFRRPGIASTLTPSLGIVHEWITSAAVTSIRTSMFIGTTRRLSTSKSRYSPIFSSSVGSMYESNSMFIKSEYSYLQYHWCPTVLIVSEGELISSVKYRRCRDGMARNTSVMAGRIVHTVSIC